MNFSYISQLCGQDWETRRSSGRGGHRHSMLVLHPDPFPMKGFRYQSNPSVLPVPQLFPRAQEFPWVFLAGTQLLHFSAEALGANLNHN